MYIMHADYLSPILLSLPLFLPPYSLPPSGTPKHIDYESVKADLESLEGVKHAHSLQIWSLTLNKTALAVHLALGMHLFPSTLLKINHPSLPFPPSLLPPPLPPSFLFPSQNQGPTTRLFLNLLPAW